ncbi:MAG TPA: hypothetical protein VE988_04235 [Gemmataceae bacterium]|nr:hypothetical protein [Gemmataceae bacterium]
MFRVFVVVLLAVCIAGGVAYYSGMLNDVMGFDTGGGKHSDPKKVEVDIGDPLYEAVALPKLAAAKQKDYREIVVEPCHVVPRDKQEISPSRDAQLLFVGQEVAGGKQLVADPSRPLKKISVFQGGQDWLDFYFQPWEEGHYVDFDQMVAKLDPALATHESNSKAAKILSAKADFDATDAILDESIKKYERLKRLRDQKGPSVVTDEELGGADATVKKYKGDRVQKQEAIKSAELEKLQADIILQLHDLRSKIPGKSIIKKIQKSNGEGVKAQETVMQLYGISRLKVEGSVDSQYQSILQKHKNARCYLEPSDDMAPVLELIKAHRAEVTCVGFCADGQHFVSGSEDTSVCIWERGQVASKYQLWHKSPVRSVACSPKGAWLLVGCADGSITLWDLTQPDQAVKVITDQHRGPVTALAFSPDGDYFASGGEDNSIVMWSADGEKMYAFDADHGVNEPHQGTITSLNFTPQCTLVSAARDNTLRVWTLGKKGAKQALAPITNRGGTVGQLGVSPQGLMLFDKGKSIQLVSMADRSTVCVLDNLAGSNPFDTLALFSPDGSLMLTGGAGEGRLHLWKTPTRNERAFQVRELVTKDRTGITSAAFSPGKQRLAVTGSKDGFVHLWALPDETTVEKHRIWQDGNNQALKLDLVEPEQNAGKTRIAANVENPQNAVDGFRLRPGQRITVVVVLPLGN